MPEPRTKQRHSPSHFRSSLLWRKLLVAILLGAFCATCPAQEAGLYRSWRIANFDGNLKIAKDGSADVIEELTFVFQGQYTGIYRRIPIEYPGPSSTNFTLFLHVNAVTDGDGHPLRYTLSTSSGYRTIRIFIPGAVDTSKKVDVFYHVDNAVRFFEDHDELYWNITGLDWPVPIGHAEAHITFPPEAVGSLRAQAFTGPYGSQQQDAAVDINGDTVNIEANHPLPMRWGLTADVYLPNGILAQPNAIVRAGWFLRSNPILALPLVAFGVMFGLWAWKGKDPNPGISVAPMYEPPKDMAPSEVGALVTDRVYPRDITCILVDLAVRGFLRIKEITSTDLMVFHHTDYELELLKSGAEMQSLSVYERALVDRLFAGGTVTRLSDQRNQFYTAIPLIQGEIMSALKTKGMYSLDPDNAMGYLLLGGVLIAAPFVLADYFLGIDFFSSGVLSVASLALTALIIFLFGRIMSAKSLLGARTVVQIRGFQEFMTRVDGDRLKRMPPDTFEKFLPYAMALGVEQRWARAFSGIVQNPPAWYSGPGLGAAVFDPWLFSRTLTMMSTQAMSDFTAAPRASSSGSGFSGSGFSSGGGFSGGGFGGGGGDAF